VGFGISALHGKTTGLAAVVRALWLLLLLRAATAHTSTARVVAALRPAHGRNGAERNDLGGELPPNNNEIAT